MDPCTNALKYVDVSVYYWITAGHYLNISAPRERGRLDISSKMSFKLLHSLRASHDAVLIGVSTLAVDAPRLNVRDPLFGNYSTNSSGFISSPRPVVVDSSLRCSEIPNIHLTRPLVFSSYLNSRKHLESNSLEQDRRSERWKVAEMKIKSLGGDLVQCIADSEDRFADCITFKFKSRQSSK